MSLAETVHAVALIRKVSEGRTLLIDRARYERRLRLGRSHLRAGVRPNRRQRHTRARSFGTARFRKAYLGQDGAMMLEVRDLHAFYGKSHILQGVSLCRRRRTRSSAFLAATASAVRQPQGLSWARLRRSARSASRMKILPASEPFEIARCDLGYVPENRDIFPSLTVRAKPDSWPEGPARWRLDGA